MPVKLLHMAEHNEYPLFLFPNDNNGYTLCITVSQPCPASVSSQTVMYSLLKSCLDHSLIFGSVCMERQHQFPLFEYSSWGGFYHALVLWLCVWWDSIVGLNCPCRENMTYMVSSMDMQSQWVINQQLPLIPPPTNQNIHHHMHQVYDAINGQYLPTYLVHPVYGKLLLEPNSIKYSCFFIGHHLIFNEAEWNWSA